MNAVSKIYFPWLTPEHEKALLKIRDGHGRLFSYIDFDQDERKLINDLEEHEFIYLRWAKPTLLTRGLKYIKNYIN